MNVRAHAMDVAAQENTSGLERGFAADIGFLRRRRHGATCPLVLLHGVGSCAESFSALAAALPPETDIIAWDAPGYADSLPLAVPTPSPLHYAAALAKFLDALKLARVAVAGHSLGALFAASFAAHYKDRVTALALLSPALGYGVAPGAKLPEGVQSRIDEIVELGPAAFARKRAARLVGDPQARPDIVAAVESAMAAVHPPSYIQAVHALGAGRLLSDAASIAAPALVAVGTRDQITPPANARATHAALANPAGFHEIPGAGHALPQEEPAAVARLLAHIVEDVAHA
jgi:pimeloyl-ACP methyl ester carboxylesterase